MLKILSFAGVAILSPFILCGFLLGGILSALMVGASLFNDVAEIFKDLRS